MSCSLDSHLKKKKKVVKSIKKYFFRTEYKDDVRGVASYGFTLNIDDNLINVGHRK